MSDTYAPPTYPVLRFIATHGMKLAVPIAVLAALAGLLLALALGSWTAAAVAVPAAALLGGILASYVEMVRVVVDTLIPR